VIFLDVIFRIPTFVKWTCLCNSSIDKKTIYSENVDFIYHYVNRDVRLPQVGEYVMFGEKGLCLADTPMLVDKIIHKYDDTNMNQDTIYIILEENILTVDYYKYMKTFTHCYDGMKEKKEVTFVPDSENYEFVPPKSLEEWKNDILILRQVYSKEESMHYSDEYLIKLSNSRCRKN